MRYGRAKAARKTLKFYSLNSSERIGPPYRVLCDGNFLAASAKHKIPLRDRLTKNLQGEKFELFVLRSALDELRDLAEAHEGREEAGSMFQEARQFGLDECEIIERDAIPPPLDGGGVDAAKDAMAELGDPGRDIVRLVSGSADRKVPPNPGGYLVATQDEALSGMLRRMPLVPQLRLSRVVLLLEAPSAASRRFASGIERRKEMSGGGLMTAQEKELISTVRRRDRADKKETREKDQREEQRRRGTERRKKKAKGPNPLSCKKRKAADASQAGSSDNADKKTRRRRKK
uniref:UTP23 sensor motif region domain-containing protein n=1 Tax=Odontella aurita TaxID=265563 RepID=A0A7S4IM16_9STRA|mmetsp:Transcript_27020/g.79840  ORF Transcript_27020/g.79840 Transcript_27020/m.79840 type:complete len:289 (+) Transcript_27020:130-996(+)|eukprot:CAMPEP_0113556706 /NCGR_PEP_ID=MMETSP0015_2-20120614/17394_1 /TAXON_ID=2838 /ORGANISM="Odontella" /LENGTH=288 /DNA_ID=CAMNT_0000458069 /DNA_START=128 /DNA_END=997 /DNA_ORIENTATION=+ /assembly_acc=CAM_ASM_000160